MCEYYNCKRILFTATPARLDGKPLDLANEMILGIKAKELIQLGNISDYNYYAPDINLDLSNVKKTAGDYNNGDLSDVMCSKKIYGDIIKYYNLLGKGEQAIAYCVNVKHSKEVCEMFNENGIKAIHMDASTPEKERGIILNKFKNKEFQILCNCNLISEGITLPSANVGLLLRPTLSLPLYIQQSCRVLTPVVGKKAVIIDYVGNVFRHGMPTAERDWSLKTKVKEYSNENEDGTLKIRVCQNCFSTFQTAPICPYCGAEYKTTDIEIQNFKEIELKRIEDAKIQKKQEYKERIKDKVSGYSSPEECCSWYELIQYCIVNGYKPGYAYYLNKKYHLNYAPYGRR